MPRLIGLFIIALDIIVIIDIVKSKMDNERKMLWIIAVVFLPLLGPVLYYLIARK